MKIIKKINFLLFFAFSVFAYAQENYNLTGKILNPSGEPASAEISLKEENSPNYQYAITDSLGIFSINLPAGNYLIEVFCDCFDAEILSLNQTLNSDLDLGVLQLNPKVVAKTELPILAKPVLKIRKDLITQKEGKRIYDVEQDAQAKGGSVADVLANVPSVTVDEDGNVSLRGNNVRVLINDKQSALVGSGTSTNNLSNIPANQIESIEVINNPSSKYDAEGQGGIINIVLKKNAQLGWNGTVRAYSGTPTNSGLDASFNHRTEKRNIFGTFSGRYQEPPGNTSFNNKFYTNNSLDSLETQRSTRIRKAFDLNFLLGTEFNIDSIQTVEVSVNFRRSDKDNTSRIFYEDFDQNKDLTDRSNRTEFEDENEYKVEGNFNYKLKFKKPNHKLNLSALASYSNEQERSEIPEFLTFTTSADPLGLQSNTLTSNDEIQKTFVGQLDYSLPLKNDLKLEFGSKHNYRQNLNDIGVRQQDLDTEELVANPFFTGETQYLENIFALYAQFSDAYNNWTYGGGVRMEYSDIRVGQLGETNHSNYNDFFPTAFLEYKINRNQNLAFNYSRRVSRPFNRFLSPFFTFSDDRNTFFGNPNLQPTYTDKLELGFNQKLGNFFLTPSLYYSYAQNPFQIVRTLGEIENVLTGDQDPIFVASPINIYNRKQTGLEMLVQYRKKSGLNITTTINAYQFDQKGFFADQSFDSKNFSWTAQSSLQAKMFYDLSLQLNGNYHGREDLGQITRKGVFVLSSGLSRDFLDKKVNFSVNVVDLFNSWIRRIRNSSVDFDSDLEMQYRQRQINFAFTYRFKPQEKENEKIPRMSNDEGGF